MDSYHENPYRIVYNVNNVKMFLWYCSAVVVLTNKSKDKDYSVTVILRVDTVLYTGKVEDSVRKDKFDILVKKKSGNYDISSSQQYWNLDL